MMVRPFSFLNNHRFFQFLPWFHVLLLLFTVCFLMVNCWNPAVDKKKEKEKEREKAKKRKAKKEIKIKTVDMEMPVRKTPRMPAEPFNPTPTPTPSPYTSPYQSTQKVEAMEPMKAAPSPSPVPPEPAESPAEEKDEEEDLFRCTDYTPESLRNQQPMFDLLEQY